MYFVIRKNSAGDYWWRAVADNNEILASSEMLTSKQNCLNAINVVRREAAGGQIKDETAKSVRRSP